MMKTCDLHTHSVYSDGTYTPNELIRAASKAGLSAVALSDHNTVAGLPSFLEAARGSGVEPVPGIEFSTEYRGTELHILALFVAPEHYETINCLLEGFLQQKEQSNRDLVHRLNQAGIFIDYDAIKAKAAGRINRAVIGAEMVRLGYCESVKAAFSQWLSEKHGYYIPAKRLDAFDAIRFIKSIGAAAVLAHPFLSLDEAGLREFLVPAREAGLDGMEVYYSVYDADTTALAQAIAEEFGLLPSGGSDFHGGNKPDISIGTGRGNLVIPLTWMEALRGRSCQGVQGLSKK